MSRYTFEGNGPELSTVVGWDNPLESYFAQVWDGGGPEQVDLKLWVGAGRDKVPTAEELAELVAPYGDIPAEVRPQLEESYAMEELVAELGAAFLCSALGLSDEPRPDHAAYLSSWLKVLKHDKRAIFTAAAQAQRAVDWIRRRAEEQQSTAA